MLISNPKWPMSLCFIATTEYQKREQEKITKLIRFVWLAILDF